MCSECSILSEPHCSFYVLPASCRRLTSGPPNLDRVSLSNSSTERASEGSDRRDAVADSVQVVHPMTHPMQAYAVDCRRGERNLERDFEVDTAPGGLDALL